MIISWFSAGVSSAVATKLLIDQIDRIIYTHIDDQHPDTMRFVRDCETWFGKPVEILQSPFKTVEAACLGAGGRGYINGATGAACTRRLKRLERVRWEYENDDGNLRYVWGIDYEESHRCDRIQRHMPKQEHIFPLVEMGISKKTAHQMLNASGVKRPAMYELGFLNNNCIGCPKGGQSYWNLVRTHFPEVFAARARMERVIGASCLKTSRGMTKGKSRRLFLDELDPEAGRGKPPIIEECGAYCGLLSLNERNES